MLLQILAVVADKALSVVNFHKTIRAAGARKSEKSGTLTSPALDGDGLVPRLYARIVGFERLSFVHYRSASWSLSIRESAIIDEP